MGGYSWLRGLVRKDDVPRRDFKHRVLYLCDGLKCGEGHDCGLCHHTSDISHARNFEKEGDIYIEDPRNNQPV